MGFHRMFKGHFMGFQRDFMGFKWAFNVNLMNI
jgi:hypothetical protein